MHIIDTIDEIGLDDDEFAQAIGRPEHTRASVLVDDVLDLSDRRVRAAARGTTRMGS